MNILIAAWEKCSLKKVREEFEAFGHLAVLYMEKPNDWKQAPRFRSMLRKFIREKHIDAVFSVKYYSVLSRACKETDIVYVCWCPTFLLEDIPEILLQYEKNYYFLFDRRAVSNLQQAGITNTFYLPYALDFPEQIEAYRDDMQIDSIVASSYQDGYLGGLFKIRECMEKYEKKLPAAKLINFQNNYSKMHSLEKRLEEILTKLM